MIIVTNITSKQKLLPLFEPVKIFRPNKLGNPFYLKSENEREQVVNAYKEWLLENIKLQNETIIKPKQYADKYKISISSKYVPHKSSDICEELNKIIRLLNDNKNVELICFCSPKLCHGDVIKKLIESKKNK